MFTILKTMVGENYLEIKFFIRRQYLVEGKGGYRFWIIIVVINIPTNNQKAPKILPSFSSSSYVLKKNRVPIKLRQTPKIKNEYWIMNFSKDDGVF